MTDDLIRRANYALGDTQGRVDAGKLALFADCIARIEELEAKLAEADAMIEAQQKDYASNNVRFAEAEHRAKAAEAKLPTVYLLGLADAAWVAAGIASQYVGYMSRVEKGICALPTPTAAELMARIQTGENE